MAATTDITQLEGNFKRIYADKIENLVPENAQLIKEIKFSQRDRLGDTFEQPVIMANEGGFTYAAPGAGAFAINTPIAMTMKNARVPSTQMLLASRMDYETASKASKGGPAAFRKSTELLVKSMMDSFTHRLECSILYGKTGLGQISSTVNASSTQTVATISDATWAMGIWAGTEGHTVEIYENAGQVGTSIFTIVSVDIDNKAITLSGSAADITILDADANGTGAGLDIYWEDSYSADMNGIDKIMTNASSLFGIDASAYNMWKGSTYNMNGALTLAKLLKSTTTSIGKGLKGKVNTYISPQQFAVLNAEMAGYRRQDSSYSVDKNTIGSAKLSVYAQNGMMDIMPHAMVKAGEGFILPIDICKRIGSTDVTFNTPGMGDKFFRQLDGFAGFELRAYSDQAFFIEKPAKCTKITGMTY